MLTAPAVVRSQPRGMGNMVLTCALVGVCIECCCCRIALSDALDKLTASLQRQQAATVSNTAASLQSGMRVLTTSLSSTVAKALIQAHQQALTTTHPAAAPAGAQQHGVAAAGANTAPSRPAQPTSAAVPQGPEGQDWVSADWVDDPDFWPETSGIGREQPSSSVLPPFLAGSSGNGGYKGSSSRGPGISVIVCESRPLCEGVVMAQRLAAAGLQVTLITDAQAGAFVEEADLVLLGADAVTPAGVVNKVGSKLLALAAKAAGVPVVAVTDSLKVTPGPVAQVALPNTVLQVRLVGSIADAQLMRSHQHNPTFRRIVRCAPLLRRFNWLTVLLCSNCLPGDNQVRVHVFTHTWYWHIPV